MPTVANLAVSVTARTGDFNRRMQESAGIVRRFGSAVVGVARRLLTFNTAMRAIKLVGVTLATRYALKFADAIIITAKKVGLATEELIGLQFAAGLAGIKITDLTKRLERIVPKLGTMQETLRNMGVSSGGLALMVEITQKLGVSMNQLQSQAVQDAIAAVRRLWTVIKAVSLELAVRLAPAIKWVAKELLHFVVLARIAVVELATRLEPYIRAASERLVQFATAGANAGMVMPRSFGLIAEAGAKLANALAFVEAAWHGLNAVVRNVTSDMLFAIDRLLDGMRHVLFMMPDLIRSIAAILPFTDKQVESMLDRVTDAQDAILKSHLKVSGLATSLATDAAESINKMNEAWAKFKAGKYGEDFKAAFEDIAERAAEVVALILKLQNIGLQIPGIPAAGGLGGAAARARRAEFQQISLSRMAVQGITTPSRPQTVHDPQLTQEVHWTQLVLARKLDKLNFVLASLGGVN